MNQKSAMLKSRLLTIAVLMPVFIALIFFSTTEIFALVLLAIIFLASDEWAKLSGFSTLPQRLIYSILIVLVGSFCQLNAAAINLEKWVYWFSSFWWLLAFIWLFLYQSKKVTRDVNQYIKLFIGVIVLLPAWFALIKLHSDNQYGPQLVLYVFLIMWVADIGAYIFGRSVGKHRLASLISPGKTIEGVIGGLFGVLILALLGAYYFELKSSDALLFFSASILAALVSVIGDLYESLLKRQAGIKDSSNILPGHGGILDRIDSITSGLPVFMLAYLYIIM